MASDCILSLLDVIRQRSNCFRVEKFSKLILSGHFLMLGVSVVYIRTILL